MLYFHVSNWMRVVNVSKEVDIERVNHKGILFNKVHGPEINKEPKKLYSLFEKIDGKWTQIAMNSFPSGECAANVFSSRLAQAPLSRSIRVVR